MDFLTWGRNPWGQWVLTHISWNLFWGSLFAGILFFVAHASYMFLSAGIDKAGTRNLIVSRIIKAAGGLAAD